ncbi:putative TLC domain-containing protein-like protein [Hapsidospora chrysogenum ATCC 11550]|uniref:Putative TLC domain-containing protein-like protein n=1 Tax=Hapsidospora chrysogenum (strain ATCC 11550 / CBS 779.69 / DSM 880 / IAM 14645 / JCM 23072 / IMI 49137) TaxID=857340 RepID=A0A086SUF1_HAPC1|nr:putative TLC domain-containing protein-like protein [Hapsidospora chrysogenum ATCC 11550]
MQDPFPIPPVPWLAELVQPWCDRFNLTTLPLHIHEVVAAALLYSVVFWPISPLISHFLAPDHYSKLPRKRRLNWDAHVVSMVQSCLINALAIWVILVDDERRAMTWEERIWGYTGGCALIQALAAGYFLWDLIVTSLNLDVFGIGTLAHAMAALLVYSLGFRPLVNYYSPIFILWELSTPFLNIHWFMDKMGMTGTRAQLYNGFLLLGSFFTCRLLFGTYHSYCVMGDFWRATRSPPGIEKLVSSSMAFADEGATVPVWAALAYLSSNLTLNFLNFYWFFKMISAVRKRFQPAKGAVEPVTEVEVDLSTVVASIPEKAQPRRRKA